jgi:hypothetical protein
MGLRQETERKEFMGCYVEYVQQEQMAVVVATGAIRDEDAKEQVAEIIGLLKEHEGTLVLIDCTEAVTEASLAGIYRLPDYATQLGAPWHLRIALVIPQTRYRIETYNFAQLVFSNAGYNVKLFKSREAAEDWLQHPPAVQRFVNQLSPA